MIEELNKEQNSRVAALKVARDVLSEQTRGPLVNKTMTADTIDLVSISSWIVDGKDPWRPKKRHKIPVDDFIKPVIKKKNKS